VKSRIEELQDPERLKLLVDSIVDYALYLISVEGDVVTWNTGAQRLKGYEAAEIVGRPYATFFTDEDRKRNIPEIALRTAARAGRFEAEGWRVRKDGSRFWALAVLDAVYSRTGELLGFAKITRDMTERELARQRLAESEERFRQLVESVTDYAIFQLDGNGIISTWNAGAARIKGYSAEEIIGKHFSIFYTEDDRNNGAPAKALAIAATEGRFETEAGRVRKDGSRFRAFVVIDPIKNEHGDVVGFAKVTRDVTERMQAQKQLEDAQQQLAASQKMEAVGQLTGGIAHDFNNLMMIILGNLESAQRHAKVGNQPNPNLVRSLQNAMRGAQRAAALTSRLLAFSRRQPLDPKPIELNKFLAGAAEFLQRSLGELIDIEVVSAPGLWQIEADPNHLESALVNLAINARDAMAGRGKITIEATNVFADEDYHRANPELSPGPYVLICVSDDGEGMPPDVLNRAFEPFFTTKEAGHGTGLGLSQVYGFIKQSGGHIKIYSEVGQGTTIKIYMPRFLRGVSGKEDELEATPITAAQQETILVTEDDADLRAYLTEMLRGLGYRVRATSDPAAALAVIADLSQPIDLLLTDVVMPGMNGRELAYQAQKSRPDLKVLYMTGYSRNAVVHHGRLEEGVELLQKPVTQAQLATRIRDILDRSTSGGRLPRLNS
jgi:PAS domain S-box-containing protein